MKNLLEYLLDPFKEEIEYELIKNDNNELIIKIYYSQDDKKEFEDWVNKLDDDLFTKTWESLADEYGLKELNDIYETNNYQEVIEIFKSRARELAIEKIDELKELFNL